MWLEDDAVVLLQRMQSLEAASQWQIIDRGCGAGLMNRRDQMMAANARTGWHWAKEEGAD
jgi:hypothetical protein